MMASDSLDLRSARYPNVLQISGKQTYSKGIETMNPINAKCVQLTRAARICLLLVMYLLGGIISPPRKLDVLKHNDLS